MKSVNYNKVLHSTYIKGRTLSDDVMAQWMNAISPKMPQVKDLRILDLGSGTGRFTQPLANWFKASVTGVEPASAMRNQASTYCTAGQISYVDGHAEKIPLPKDSVHAVFASMSIHHFKDLDRGCREISRVLKPNGMVFIRNTFSGRLNSPCYHFFPSTIEVNNARLPSINDVTCAFQKAGIVQNEHQTITQRIDDSLSDHCERLKQKSLSIFELISDEEFQAGIQNLEEALQQEASVKPVYEDIDLLIYKKES